LVDLLVDGEVTQPTNSTLLLPSKSRKSACSRR